MRRSFPIVLPLFLLVSLTLPACGALGKKTFSVAEASKEPYQLQLGDQLEISVWEHAELSQKIQVREDGTFPFPLIGSVRAAGRTTAELEKEIQDRLNQDYIINPQVSVRLIGAKFTAMGEVNNPGNYAIEGTLDLLSAISLAGGISKFGSSRVVVIRSVGDQKVVIRADVARILKGKDPNFSIQPRDTIYARRRLF